MPVGEPDAGNPHVRFDEGEQRDWLRPPVALYSTASVHLPKVLDQRPNAQIPDQEINQ